MPKIYENINISKQLKQTREELNMSQAHLASLIGVSPAAISQYESGEKKPNIYNFLKLSKILGVSTNHLLGEKPETSVSIQSLFPGLNNLMVEDQENIIKELKDYYQYLLVKRRKNAKKI